MYVRDDRRGNQRRSSRLIRDVLGTGNGYGRGFPWTMFATATRWIRRRADCFASTYLYPSINRILKRSQPSEIAAKCYS